MKGQQNLRIALTPGAENGVGPELLIKALTALTPLENISFLWCGDRASLALACTRARISFRDGNYHAELAQGIQLKFFPDFLEQDLVKRQALFLDLSVDLAKAQSIDAIVTGPVEKAALLHVSGGPFFGQTEYFATHLGTGEKPFMAFMGAPFILSLLTTHLPLREVANTISEDMIFEHITSVAKHVGALQKKEPHRVKIAILGLNPHAGEGGLLGHEEQIFFAPAIARARQRGLDVDGPLAADGFFAYLGHHATLPDVVVSAYHDQGLCAIKVLANHGAVNVTLGLSHVRVSPAHGTATELVGQHSASVASTLAALNIACDLAYSKF